MRRLTTASRKEDREGTTGLVVQETEKYGETRGRDVPKGEGETRGHQAEAVRWNDGRRRDRPEPGIMVLGYLVNSILLR